MASPSPNELIHSGLVTPYGDIDLGQLWFRSWLVAWQHQAITRTTVHISSSEKVIKFNNEVLWHSPESNFTASALATTLYNEFDNSEFKLTATSPRGQSVKYQTVQKTTYRQVSNIRRTKLQHLKYSRTVLWLSLPNPLKPDVKSRMKA